LEQRLKIYKKGLEVQGIAFVHVGIGLVDVLNYTKNEKSGENDSSY
jgi:hypothetical protein